MTLKKKFKKSLISSAKGFHMQSLQSESAEKCTIIQLSNLERTDKAEKPTCKVKARIRKREEKRKLTLVEYWSMVL